MTAPLLSLVLPVRDDADVTLRCLEAIAREPDDVPFEIVVVDDGSQDGTPQLLAGLDGDVQVLRNDEPQGFAAAFDQGAAVARGEHLVLLAQHGVPCAGWLRALAGALMVPAALAAVVSRSARPDGAWAPDAHWLALGVRRDAYEAVGGFAGAARPGRAEKASLLEALREHGAVTECGDAIFLAAPAESVAVDVRRPSAVPSPRPASAARVSCVVTAYNYGRFIGRCLDSVLAQDHPRELLEVVVVDDGSTDDTREVVAAYGDAVRYVHQENAGQIAATNRGIAEATGDYLILVDADDTIPPDRVSTQAAILDARDEVGLVYGDMTIIDADDRLVRDRYHGPDLVRPHAGHVLGPLLLENFIPGGTMMFRARDRGVYHPIPPQASVQDWWIGTRLAAVSEIAYVARPMNHYRLHGANDSHGAEDQRKLRLTADDLRFRRWVLGHMNLSSVAIDHVLHGQMRFDYFLRQVSEGLGRPAEELLSVSRDEGAGAEELLARARMALAGGDAERAARTLVRAIATDPHAVPARDELAALLPGGAGAPPRLEARSFVTLALADELLEHPRLLAAYASAFAGEDDATLVIYAADGDPTVAERLGALVAEAGLDGPGSPDMAVVLGPRDPAQHPGVARGSHAALTERAALVPAGIRRFAEDEVAALRAHADACLDGVAAAPLAAAA